MRQFKNSSKMPESAAVLPNQSLILPYSKEELSQEGNISADSQQLVRCDRLLGSQIHQDKDSEEKQNCPEQSPTIVTQSVRSTSLFNKTVSSACRFAIFSYVAILLLVGGSVLIIQGFLGSSSCGRIVSNVRIERVGDVYTELERQCKN